MKVFLYIVHGFLLLYVVILTAGLSVVRHQMKGMELDPLNQREIAYIANPKIVKDIDASRNYIRSSNKMWNEFIESFYLVPVLVILSFVLSVIVIKKTERSKIAPGN